jgi:hypothetical protein
MYFEDARIPAGELGEPIIGQQVGALLFGGEMRDADNRDLVEPIVARLLAVRDRQSRNIARRPG